MIKSKGYSTHYSAVDFMKKSPIHGQTKQHNLGTPVIFTLLLVLSLLTPIVFAQTLTAQIDALIAQQLPHATVGIFIKDAQTGQIIYRSNANKLLSPASGTKLFTAAAAMYQLKPNYQFLTTLSQKNDDFYMTFSGSPSLTVASLKKLILNLKKSGVKTIPGNLILDGSRYEAPYYAGGVSYDDLGWYYAAPDTAIILNENAMAFDFISATKLGKLVQIKPKTPETGLTIINQVITVSKEQQKQHCNLNIEIQSNNTLRLFGCLAQDSKPQEMKLAVPDPLLLAKQTIKKLLEEQGIALKGHIISGVTPPGAKTIASVRSKDLTQLITHMLQESDNVYANSLYKQLAYSLTGEGSYKQGAYAIKQILAQYTHLDWNQLELADGAGARYNLVTPEQTVVLLTDLYNDNKLHNIILQALPQAGVSGSLKSRLKKTNLEKNVFAKTGTMHDISSLSGYIVGENNRPIIFSIIINGVNVPIDTAKSLEEQILLAVDEYLVMAQPVYTARKYESHLRRV